MMLNTLKNLQLKERNFNPNPKAFKLIVEYLLVDLQNDEKNVSISFNSFRKCIGIFIYRLKHQAANKTHSNTTNH